MLLTLICHHGFKTNSKYLRCYMLIRTISHSSYRQWGLEVKKELFAQKPGPKIPLRLWRSWLQQSLRRKTSPMFRALSWFFEMKYWKMLRHSKIAASHMEKCSRWAFRVRYRPQPHRLHPPPPQLHHLLHPHRLVRPLLNQAHRHKNNRPIPHLKENRKFDL